MRALLDTSAVIAVVRPDEPTPALGDLSELAVSTLTWTELAAGLYTPDDAAAVAVRLDQYARLRTLFVDTLPYDDACVRAYQRVLTRVVERGGQPKAHLFDRMIAATALAFNLPLATRDRGDISKLAGLIEILEV